MNDQIICPHCKKPIPLTQALSHEVKEKLEIEQKKELETQKQKLNEEAKKWREDQIKKLEEKVKQESDFKLKDAKNESEELRSQNKNLHEQLLELNKLIRALKTEKEQESVEFEKKLLKETDAIREKEKEKFDEEYRLKMLEKEKQLTDALKVNEELKRKLEQGSQQMQGEVVELELENVLKKEFPYDEIKEVPKGVKGADIIQIVKNNYGRSCGTIIWELKRTKNWTDSWIAKLKEDQRTVKADIAVIISQVLPVGIKFFSQEQGVWIGGFDTIVSLSLVLRNSLIEISTVRSSTVGKQEKKEILWNYLTSIEFRQRLEALYENTQMSKIYLDKEKEFFRRKWAREEKNLQLISTNLLGMHGDLQAIIGKSLPEVASADQLTDGEKGKDETKIEDKLF